MSSALGIESAGENSAPSDPLNAVIRPEDLRAVGQRHCFERPGVARGERQVSGDMPILSQGDVCEVREGVSIWLS